MYNSYLILMGDECVPATTRLTLASHADVLWGSSRGAVTRDEPLRMSAWEVTVVLGDHPF